jgi:hypothetical protein
MRQSGDAGATMSRGSMFEIMREFAACLCLGQLLWAAAMPSVTMGVSAEKYRAEKLRTGLIPLERARVTFATRICF